MDGAEVWVVETQVCGAPKGGGLNCMQKPAFNKILHPEP